MGFDVIGLAPKEFANCAAAQGEVSPVIRKGAVTLYLVIDDGNEIWLQSWNDALPRGAKSIQEQVTDDLNRRYGRRIRLLWLSHFPTAFAFPGKYQAFQRSVGSIVANATPLCISVCGRRCHPRP